MEFELAVKLTLVVIIVLFFVLRARFIRHSTKYTPKIFVKYIISIILMVFYFSGFFDNATIPLSNIVRIAIGLPIAFLGFILFFWSHTHLGSNWSPVIEKKFSKSRNLVTSGPYHYVRHPIYTSSFIVLIGIFIFTANWIIGGIPTAILGLFYASKIPREEAELTRNFGKVYIDYMKKTYSLIPGIY